jgi:hypothetical protein
VRAPRVFISEIIGEDVRQHRRTLRTAWSAAALLAVLLVVALVAAVLAKHDADETIRERDVATSRLLAMRSDSRREQDNRRVLRAAAGRKGGGNSACWVNPT